MRLKNRIIKAPQYTGLANPDGLVTDRMLRYYKEVASRGLSMVIRVAADLPLGHA